MNFSNKFYHATFKILATIISLYLMVACSNLETKTSTSTSPTATVHALVGQWKLTKTSSMGKSEMTMIINKDLSGSLLSERMGESTVQNLVMHGEEVRFSTTLSVMGREIDANFKGKLENGILKGSLNTDYGSSNILGVREVK